MVCFLQISSFINFLSCFSLCLLYTRKQKKWKKSKNATRKARQEQKANRKELFTMKNLFNIFNPDNKIANFLTKIMYLAWLNFLWLIVLAFFGMICFNWWNLSGSPNDLLRIASHLFLSLFVIFALISIYFFPLGFPLIAFLQSYIFNRIFRQYLPDHEFTPGSVAVMNDAK